MNVRSRGARFASPRLRGEVGTRSVPGEGEPPHIPMLTVFAERGPSPQLSPRERGEREN